VVGLASWYTGTGRTADGERLRPGALTAASPTVPFGTRLRVCRAGRCIVVRVNDRGPYTGGRILDLTLAGATDLGYRSAGTARVSVTRLREVVAG
jgi:rare lipoprotein A